MLRHYFKKLLYLFVFIGVSSAQAGSFDDFFTAIVRDDDRVIGALLARGFDPNTVDSTGSAGLLLAVKASSIKVATRLASWPGTKVEVRNANLSAYYLPDGGEELLYPSITPVNTFRIVFNKYFGANYPLLEDVARSASYQDPYNFEIVNLGCDTTQGQ